MTFVEILPRMPNKALHCYLLMIIWILLLVAGVYKFLEPKQKLPEPSVNAELFHNLANDIKTRRIFKICNFPNEIAEGDEGTLQSKKWAMTGLIVLIRHGDRGPLQHVRNISSVNCGADDTEKFISYKSYLHNLTVSGRAPWTGPGPFHDFPLLPTHPRQCQLGQLTMQGIHQLLKLGQLLRESYMQVWPKLSSLSPSEVLVYSTRYRRTFQSALSFLFGLVPPDTLSKVPIFESQSMNFCFKDCGCPITDKLWKGVKKSISHQLKSHPAVALLAESTGRSLFSPGAEQGDPHAVRDALLTYVCHGSGLPCETPSNCIKRQNVAGVFAYTDWVNYQKWRNVYWKRLCLLRSYGLIRHIVQQMLHMVSRNGPFLVLYSGHDHTVEQLTTALGLQNDPLLLRYGARVVFEVYQNHEESHNGAKDRMASNIPDFFYSCEICGLEGLSEDEFRSHTRTAHVDGNAVCPFCELSAVTPAELILHVNQAHLDYLTPESESNMTFIDDVSPSEYNGLNGETSHWIPSLPAMTGGKTVNNINLSPKVNGGGELSPKNSTHGQGSPLRSSLALKLKSAAPKLQCPICSYTSTSPSELEEHVNRRHFDLTSPSVGGTGEIFSCPLCVKSFNSAPDLELHVNIEHRDVLSPASPATHLCPVCGIALDNESNSESAARHVESHFPAGSPQPAERAALREREQREFELLRAQYGMDNQGNFREQSVTNMQRAVYAGEMSVADYYERTLDLRAAESCGIDDGSSVTRSIVPRVRAMSTNAANVVRTLLCTCVDHYASSYGDRGWGCGYRNTQMLISSLLTHTGHNERLYKLWQGQKPPRSSVPSISRLQSLIEQAWSQGFDIQGSEQLGCRLVNTRKWIGATEVVTLLSFLRIKCQLVDFHRPTGPGGTHPELFHWVLKYFENGVGGEFTPPLYLQHQGHSRTIMGIEVHRDGSLILLVLDPSHSPQQMAQFGDTNSSAVALRLLRKSEAAMKARQYQIVAVIGTIDSEQQYQQSKILRGTRIPQDR